MPDLPSILGRNLRRIRKSRRMTQEQFRDATGISQSYLSELETGKKWGPIGDVAGYVAAAGGDPLELLLSPALADLRPNARAIVSYLPTLSDEDLFEILSIVRLVIRRPGPPAPPP